MGIVVIVTYKPNPGDEAEFVDLIKQHEPALRAAGLVTDRPFTILESDDGILIEIFEWASEDASRAANSNDAIQAIWRRMAEIGSFVAGKDVAAFQTPFAHFSPKVL